MKKFFVVAIICIVTASLGLLTYNFMATKEKIMIDNVVYYVNVGEDFTVDYERVNPKSSTNINLSYDGFGDLIQESKTKENTYTAVGAGKAVMKLDANISGFTSVTITVYIGDGSTVAPHYIDSVAELSKVGTGEGYVKGDGYFSADASYVLTKDIDLENASFEPLCNTDEGFTGKFNFADYSISNFVINTTKTDNAGLFAKIGKNGQVIRASINNVNIDGSYTNAGAVAGINEGKITNAKINGVNINDVKDNSNVGGLVGYSTGKISTSMVKGESTSIVAGSNNSNAGGLVGLLVTESVSNVAEITRSYADNLKIHGQLVGGLVGRMTGAEIRDIYANGITLNGIGTNAIAGGLVGQMEYQNTANNLGSSILNGYVADYHFASVNDSNKDVIVGKTVDYNRTEITLDTANVVIGVYNIGDGTTKLSSSNYVFVGNIASQSAITSTSFKTKTNVKENASDSSDLRVVNFDSNIWTISDGEYPTINMDGVDTTSNILRTGNVGFADTIDTIKDSKDNANVSKIVLKGDIDGNNTRISTLGDLNKEFDGANYTIKNFRIDGPLFTKITSKFANVTFENIVVVSNDFNLAILAGQNEGSIDNVKFVNCTITVGQNLAETELNVGVVASINDNYIQNIVIKSTSINLNETRKANVNVGFISGKNNSTVQKAVIYNNNQINVSSNLEKTTYVGGAVGDNNNGSIEFVSVGYNANILGENATSIEKALVAGPRELSTLTIGGIAGYNQGRVRYNEVSGTFYGYRFGGLIGENNVQNSMYVVEENNVSSNTYAQAMDLGGLVAIENYGLVQNCSTFATLNGFNGSSRIGGVAVELHNYQTIDHCFISTSFTGEGSKHYEIGTDGHIHSMDDNITNVIINTKNMNGAKSNNYNETDSWVSNVGGWFMNIWNNYTKEIRVSDEDCQNLVTYTNNGFSEEVWILGNEYPRLQRIASSSNSLSLVISSLV